MLFKTRHAKQNYGELLTESWQIHIQTCCQS